MVLILSYHQCLRSNYFFLWGFLLKFLTYYKLNYNFISSLVSMSLITHLLLLWQILDCGFGFRWFGIDFNDRSCKHRTFDFNTKVRKLLLPVRLLVCEEETYSLELRINQWKKESSCRYEHTDTASIVQKWDFSVFKASYSFSCNIIERKLMTRLLMNLN